MKSSKRLTSHFSELGFIEVEMMIAAGLVVLLVASVSAGIAMMSKFQRSNDAAADSYYVLQQLITTVRTQNTCTLALQGATIPTSIAGGETPVTVPVDLGAGPVSVSAGSIPIPGVKIKDLTLAFNNLVPSAGTVAPQLIPTSAGTLQQYVLNLRLSTEKIVDTQSTGFTKPKDIPVSVLVDASNRIQYCEIDAAEARACAETGGIWDPLAALNTLERCKPRDAHCDVAGSYSIGNAACGPNTFVNHLTGGRNCPAGFIRQRTGTLAQSVQSGKETVDNTFCPIYTCVRCSDRVPALANAPLIGPITVPNATINGAIQDNATDQQTTSTLLNNNNNFIWSFP